MKKKILILKTQRRFKSEKYKVFTEDISNIALSSSDDKRMQSINLRQTYGTSKDQVYKKKKIKFNKIIKQYESV